mmetsp:Transcript_89328/g.288807  ORF Transcript_89328/g.288807 Transcript_89328/m.288807 type:complete len:124 (+) Transcript_89328:1207-1578(+)
MLYSFSNSVLLPLSRITSVLDGDRACFAHSHGSQMSSRRSTSASEAQGLQELHAVISSGVFQSSNTSSSSGWSMAAKRKRLRQAIILRGFRDSSSSSSSSGGGAGGGHNGSSGGGSAWAAATV